MGRYLDIARAAAVAEEGHASTASTPPGEHYSGCAKSDISAKSLVPSLEADLPDRPADRAEFVTELVLRDGQWAWRQRRADEADRACAVYLMNRRAGGQSI